MTTEAEARERLEYLRGQIHAECISYGEVAELQCLAAYIEPGDVELLEWAGVPEFEERTDMDPHANLKQQLTIARKLIADLDGMSSDQFGDEQDRSDWFEDQARAGAALAELVLALDEWRRKDGFDPYGKDVT